MTTARPRPFLRGRLPEIWGAGGGAAFGILFVFVTAPSNFMSEVVVVSGPDCGKSENLVRAILADPELQTVFTPLSVSDDSNDSVVAGVCDVAYEHVLANAPWFRIAGKGWVCARLREDAVRYLDEAHAVLPVWVHDGSVVDVKTRDGLLSSAGFHLLPSGEGVVSSADLPEVAKRPVPRPSELSELRGQDIGF